MTCKTDRLADWCARSTRIGASGATLVLFGASFGADVGSGLPIQPRHMSHIIYLLATDSPHQFCEDAVVTHLKYTKKVL